MCVSVCVAGILLTVLALLAAVALRTRACTCILIHTPDCVCLCLFVGDYRAYVGGTSAPQGSIKETRSRNCVFVCLWVCQVWNGPFIAAGGYKGEDGAEAVSGGHADLVAYGR